MYSDPNALNVNSMEMLEYIELEDQFSDNRPIGGINRNRNSNTKISNKIKMKSGLALMRLSMFYLFYYLDEYQMTPFIKNLIGFLLIHEALVLTNSIIIYSNEAINIFLNRRQDRDYPTFSAYLDVFNNFLFFTWFIYGNICILTDKQGIEESLLKNKMLTYFITVLIMLGFFIYSKLIFYIIFFISFCPCITYVLCFDLHEEYRNHRRVSRLYQSLKEETYEEYINREGIELEMCVICTNEFINKDLVVNLSCNSKHTFHTNCIKRWIDKKAVCPLCRIDLYNPDDTNQNNHQIINQGN